MAKRPPAVRMATPNGRPIQLRYFDPDTGKEIRISTGTRDAAAAAEQKKDLEAKLRLNQDAKPSRRVKGGPTMPWSDFRESYSVKHLSRLKSGNDAESRLDIAERILKPKTLADVASREALNELQRQLLDGAERRKIKVGGEMVPIVRPRAAYTVKNTMAIVIAALHWAEREGWLLAVPSIHAVKTAKIKHMKGRPITAEEFDRMIVKTAEVVGDLAAPSWRYSLRGLWESGLRLGELLHVHWTDPRYIVPAWPPGGLPVLGIPASMQKNATEECIPLVPGFERLLLQTPDDQRVGWAFNPASLQPKLRRRPRHGRITTAWAGKIISRIGEKAGIIVQPASATSSAKFASAHDLRRSFADRLVAAGVPEREVAAVLRHASTETTRRHYAPGNVQRSAGVLQVYLGTTAVANAS